MRLYEGSGQHTDKYATDSGQCTDDCAIGSRMLVTDSNWDWRIYEVNSEGGHQFTTPLLSLIIWIMLSWKNKINQTVLR